MEMPTVRRSPVTSKAVWLKAFEAIRTNWRNAGYVILFGFILPMVCFEVLMGREAVTIINSMQSREDAQTMNMIWDFIRFASGYVAFWLSLWVVQTLVYLMITIYMVAYLAGAGVPAFKDVFGRAVSRLVGGLGVSILFALVIIAGVTVLAPLLIIAAFIFMAPTLMIARGDSFFKAFWSALTLKYIPARRGSKWPVAFTLIGGGALFVSAIMGISIITTAISEAEMLLPLSTYHAASLPGVPFNASYAVSKLVELILLGFIMPVLPAMTASLYQLTRVGDQPIEIKA